MLFTLPLKLETPSNGFQCLYLFTEGETLKIGRTNNLRNRQWSDEYKNMVCLCYFGPLEECHFSEKLLIEHFRKHFAQLKGKEWFTGNELRAYIVFSSFVSSLL